MQFRGRLPEFCTDQLFGCRETTTGMRLSGRPRTERYLSAQCRRAFREQSNQPAYAPLSRREAPRSSVMSEPCGSHSFFAVRRRADRTVTLSQIVHFPAPSHEYKLRCMLNGTLILITSAASAMTRTAPFFASPNGTVRSFLPTRMIITKRVAQ